MKSIEHLAPSEQEHFIQCDCGEYVDIRNLAEVFQHLHVGLPEPVWTHAIKKGLPVAHLKSGERLDLN